MAGGNRLPLSLGDSSIIMTYNKQTCIQRYLNSNDRSPISVQKRLQFWKQYTHPTIHCSNITWQEIRQLVNCCTWMHVCTLKLVFWTFVFHYAQFQREETRVFTNTDRSNSTGWDPGLPLDPPPSPILPRSRSGQIIMLRISLIHHVLNILYDNTGLHY